MLVGHCASQPTSCPVWLEPLEEDLASVWADSRADLLLPKGVSIRAGGLSKKPIVFGSGAHMCLLLEPDDFIHDVPGTHHTIYRYKAGAHCSLGAYDLVWSVCVYMCECVYVCACVCVVGGGAWWID